MKDRHPTLKDIKVTGALAHRIHPSGKRAIKLTNAEKRDFIEQRIVERAVALFLDLENDHTWAEIALELGITLQHLKDLSKTTEFMDAYTLHYSELGSDPRLKAVQTAIVDMLPGAFRELKKMVVDPETPAATRLNAIKLAFQLGGVSTPKGGVQEKSELATFLKDMGMGVEEVKFSVPAQYQRPIDVVARNLETSSGAPGSASSQPDSETPEYIDE